MLRHRGCANTFHRAGLVLLRLGRAACLRAGGRPCRGLLARPAGVPLARSWVRLCSSVERGRGVPRVKRSEKPVLGSSELPGKKSPFDNTRTPHSTRLSQTCSPRTGSPETACCRWFAGTGRPSASARKAQTTACEFPFWSVPLSSCPGVGAGPPCGGRAVARGARGGARGSCSAAAGRPAGLLPSGARALLPLLRARWAVGVMGGVLKPCAPHACLPRAVWQDGQ